MQLDCALGVPARAQVLVGGDVVIHQAERVEEEAEESETDHTGVEAHADGHQTHVSLNFALRLKGIDLVCHVEEVDRAYDCSGDGVQRCQSKERQEVLEVALANACSHPGAVMVLGLDADAAGAAVEGTGWPDDHASCAQGESVCFSVRVDDGGVLEAIVREEVGGTIASVWPLNFGFVLHMDSIFLETLVTNLRATLAWNGRDDAWLRHCAAVDQSQQVANTRSVDQVGQDAANESEQLQVSDKQEQNHLSEYDFPTFHSLLT